MRVVLDTNIFISGLLIPKSNAGKIIKFWLDEHRYELCLSESMIAEIEKVLHYPKIRKRLQLSDSEIEKYCALLRFHCHLAEIKNIKASVPKDKKDDHILATFLAGEADYLISGDDDLLSLKDEYKILSPKEFLEKF
jgi:putative PIN family toxin of toxin-antitoxin system